VGKATVSESAAGTVLVTAANVKSVMMARRRRALRRAVTKMFSTLRSVGVEFTVYVRVMKEKGWYCTAVHHPVCVDERESTSELLCEGTDLALRESPPAINDPIEKRIGLRCIGGASAHWGWTQCEPHVRKRLDYIIQRLTELRPVPLPPWPSSKYVPIFINKQVLCLLTISSTGHRK
jgi:hypothetical protein